MGLGVVLSEFLFAAGLAACGKREDYWGKAGGRVEEGLFMLE